MIIKKNYKIKDKKNTKLYCCTSQFYLLLSQLNIKKINVVHGS